VNGEQEEEPKNEHQRAEEELKEFASKGDEPKAVTPEPEA